MRRSLFVLSVSTLLGSTLPGCSSSSSPSGKGDAGTDGGVVYACTSAPGVTMHSIVTADETWSASAGEHIIETGLTIPSGITVTLDPCVVVRLGDGANLNVDGKLVSLGQSGRPVTLTAIDATKPWGWIDATRTAVRPPLELAYTTIENGGKAAAGDLEASSMVRLRANTGTTGEAMIRVDQVTLRGSASVGIELADSSTFAPGSIGLTITGGASEPVRMNGWALSDLPDGDYTGNAVDRLVINPYERLGIADMPATIVMHKRNVSYRVGTFGGNDLVVTLGAPTGLAVTTLQIEAGATVAFNKDTGIFVASVSNAASGEIVIAGTAAEPVTLTSAAAAPLAGDWRGIMFGAPPTTATKLDRVVFEYSGSTNTQTSGFSCGTEPAPGSMKGGIMGALSFATDRAVTRQILTNSIIRDSGSNGVDRGWRGDPVDYLATNTFERITWCRQTAPQPAMGVCAAPAPCE